MISQEYQICCFHTHYTCPYKNPQCLIGTWRFGFSPCPRLQRSGRSPRNATSHERPGKTSSANGF